MAEVEVEVVGASRRTCGRQERGKETRRNLIRTVARLYTATLTKCGQQLRIALLGWNVLGLLWQSLAVYVIVQKPLGLKIDWWWSSPGVLPGVGRRLSGGMGAGRNGRPELVFVTAMHVLLPDGMRARFVDPEVFAGFLAFLSVLLRLWTVAGEFILAAIA